MILTRKDEYWFTYAARCAELSNYDKHQVGCVIVYKNKIISTGFNKNRTDPLQMKYNKERNISIDCEHKIHAEIDAIKHIINLDIKWDHVSIYIYRKRRSQPFGMARPCKSCMALIRDMGIRDIHYTTDNGYAHEILK